MTVAFTSFLSEVMPIVNGCPSPMAINAVRDATLEFCRKTRYWQHDLTPFASVADQETYTLTPPTNTIIVGIIKNIPENLPAVSFNGVTIAEAHGYLPAEHESDSASTPEGYYLSIIGNEYTIRPYPIVNEDVADAFEVKVALAPSRTATGCDDRIYTDHVETIAAGALSRLLLIPQKPWTNPGLAQMKGAEFRRGCGSARITVSKNFTNASLSVRPRSFT
jgi:hypothetical protein